MFLYARLVMENLENQPSPHHLQNEIGRFPAGLDEA
jgi:hypothetical protein